MRMDTKAVGLQKPLLVELPIRQSVMSNAWMMPSLQIRIGSLAEVLYIVLRPALVGCKSRVGLLLAIEVVAKKKAVKQLPLYLSASLSSGCVSKALLSDGGGAWC